MNSYEKIKELWEKQEYELLNRLLNQINEDFLNNYDDLNDFIESLDGIIGGYGVEPLNVEWVSHYWQDTVALYINKGDTYDTTIIYNTKEDKFEVMDWGTWLEYAERD